MNDEDIGPTHANDGIHQTRRNVAVGVVGAAVVATAVGLLVSSNGEAPPGGRSPGGTSPGGAAAPLSVRPAIAIPARQTGTSRPTGTTEVATVLSGALRYAMPGLLSGGTVPATWYGRPSVLPVIAARPGWVEVRLAQRPNGSTTWLSSSAVKLSSTPYRIVIDVTTMRLSLFDRGQQVLSAPAGIGTAGDPTPTGQFFVAFDEPPPQPNLGYGPFIMVTSAHSPNISNWEDSGDAVIGIHGPVGADSFIGASGARISHGCIRLHEQALRQLASVPAGTPIDVVS
jgi:lipoprotein-anchoring transpeptidase ErfK/SrfK